ncbi:hypothetical protein K8I61_13740 [bacterium]|nr:hypothetical protein [bacterium]
MVQPRHCDVCGTDFKLGQNRYTVNIRITSAFDGHLPELVLDESERAEAFERLSSRLATVSAEDAENEVFQEMEFMMCPQCRRDFLRTVSDLTGDVNVPKNKQPTLLQ